MIRNGTLEDARKITEIYNYYILNSIISFEETPISADEMRLRMKYIIDQGMPWIVAEHDGDIIGYAYAGKWNARAAYRNSAETTIYLDYKFIGAGYGTSLYSSLLNILREKGYHTAIGGVALPNERSVRLHESLGYKKVAHYSEVGYKMNKWIDVAYWQIILT